MSLIKPTLSGIKIESLNLIDGLLDTIEQLYDNKDNKDIINMQFKRMNLDVKTLNRR